MGRAGFLKCQLPEESVRDEINRIVRYLSRYPAEHMYLLDDSYGNVPHWSVTGVQSIQDYYYGILEQSGEDISDLTVCREDRPVWMCSYEVVAYMEDAGLIDVRDNVAYATSWLMEYGSRLVL